MPAFYALVVRSTTEMASVAAKSNPPKSVNHADCMTFVLMDFKDLLNGQKGALGPTICEFLRLSFQQTRLEVKKSSWFAGPSKNLRMEPNLPFFNPGLSGWSPGMDSLD